MALIFAVLAWMMLLAPGREHIEAATAIAQVAFEDRPLFVGDESRMRTAALLTAIAFRESSLRNDAVSKTNDHCLMQINKRPDLARDVVACVRVAVTMLHESMRACPDHPIAFYASGPGACTNARAQAISRDRMALARRLLSSEDRSGTRFAGLGAP
jgi:hypothetical protein